MLSGVPKHKQAVMCLTKKIPVLDKPPSGTPHRAVDCEFGVIESPVWYIQKKEEEIHPNVCEAAPLF